MGQVCNETSYIEKSWGTFREIVRREARDVNLAFRGSLSLYLAIPSKNVSSFVSC